VSDLRKDSGSTIPLEDHVFVALVKAADTLALQGEQLFKASGLSATQYNVLRILRGAEPAGLACRAIGERMISHDPDITRLLDKAATDKVPRPTGIDVGRKNQLVSKEKKNHGPYFASSFYYRSDRRGAVTPGSSSHRHVEGGSGAHGRGVWREAPDDFHGAGKLQGCEGNGQLGRLGRY
jgi:hypothetical protein